MPMNNRTLRPGGKAFTPASIANLALWLDASDATSMYQTSVAPVADPISFESPPQGWWSADNTKNTIVDGRVNALADKTSNGRTLSSFVYGGVTTAPLLISSAVGGNPVMRFGGSESLLSSDEFADEQPEVMFAVLRVNGSWAGNIFDYQDSNTSDAFGLSSIGSFSAGAVGASEGVIGATVDAREYAVVTVVNSQGSCGVRKNGVPATTGSGYAFANNEFNILVLGASDSASGDFDIAELIHYSAALSAEKIVNVERYLGEKYGIVTADSSVAQAITAVSAPTDIAGCVGWWDASDSSNITTVDVAGVLKASVWRDKSSRGNHATASGTARPTVTSSGLNGKSVMTFDGTANAMTVVANAVFNSSDLTYFVVFKQDSAANKGVYTKLSATAGTLGFGLVARSDPQVWMLQKNQGSAQVLTASINPATQARIYSVASSTAASGFLDGLSTASATGQTADHSLNQNVTIGARASSEYLNGYIAEIIHFNTVLSSIDRARVEKYLAAKWGINNVPNPAPTVGYWRDKSGNSRHALQATAANRPTSVSPSLNAKGTIAFSGASAQRLGTTLTAGLGSDAFTLLAVLQNPTSASGVAMGERGGNFTAALHYQLTPNRLTIYPVGRTEQTYSPHSGAAFVYGLRKDSSSLWRGYQNSAMVFSDNGVANTSLNLANLLRNIGSSTAGASPFTGNIAELIAYQSILSDSDRRRLERYLASKYGITLAPAASNADAQDWINRVYINGGIVSDSTASAVNGFCNAIDSVSGLREAMYRLNLFCGGQSGQSTGLNAALTPLYRNWKVYGGRNLQLYGDNLTSSNWTKSSCSASLSLTERPFSYGPFANLITPTAGTGLLPYVVNISNGQGSGTITVSAYLKSDGLTTARLLLVASGMTFPGGGSVAYANINLTTGAVSSVLSGATAVATNVGNGWWRLAMTVTTSGSGNMAVRFDLGGGSPYNPTGSERLLIWGIQSEVSASATEYDPYPLGNASDTNVGGLFIGSDYIETGSTSGGLTGNGSSKYLTTGLTTAALPQIATGHLAAYLATFPTAGIRGLVTSLGSGFGNQWYSLEANRGGAGDVGMSWGNDSPGTNVSAASGTGNGMIIASRVSTTSLKLYRNGAQVGSTSTAPITPAANNGSGFAVFANYGSAAGNWSDARFCAYSIGGGLNDEQASAYYTAMQAFQSAMQRSV